MKKIIFTAVLMFLTLSAVNANVLPGSYWKTCHRCYLNNHNTLVCRCLDRRGFPRTTTLHHARACNSIKNINGDLTCIQSRHRHHGDLKPLPRGSYLKTCHACTHVGNVLSCVCNDRNGFARNTVLTDPRQCRGIRNINGRLICR